jgi:SAM-dependent methyltransferase
MTQNRRVPSNWQVWQESDVAVAFTKDRRSGILGAQEQLATLLHLLPKHDDSSELRVLDMGCGDGILLATVLTHWTQAQGVALDGSPTMLDLAHKRFASYPAGQVQCVEKDFNEEEWYTALPFDSYDAIISGFAIHHSEDARKQEIYANIFGLLRPGGVFVNTEHVASASPLGEELFEYAYAQSVTRKRHELGQDIPFEKVLHEISTRLDKSANRLTLVETQLQWLRSIGFKDVDCYWKHYELAVLAGYKP